MFPDQPIFIPKLHINFAEFPYLLELYQIESVQLGNLLRFRVRNERGLFADQLCAFHGHWSEMKCKQRKSSLHSFGCVEIFLKVNLESILEQRAENTCRHVAAPTRRCTLTEARAQRRVWNTAATTRIFENRTATPAPHTLRCVNRRHCAADVACAHPKKAHARRGVCGHQLATLIRKDNSYSSVSVRSAKCELMSPIEKKLRELPRRRRVWSDTRRKQQSAASLSLPHALVLVRCDANCYHVTPNSCAGILTCFIFGKLPHRIGMWPFDDWVCQFSLMPTNSCRNDLCKKPFSTSFLLVFITVIATTNKICTTDGSTYHYWKNASKHVSTSLYMLQEYFTFCNNQV
jgi:hypothetical protein